MVERTTGSRGIRKRSNRVLAPEQVPRFHCDHCKRDISRKIRIKCADCADFDLCVECFAVGVESQEHKKTHRCGHASTPLHRPMRILESRYRVIDDLSFAVFSSSWGADEELLFFDGICDFGISNWEAVAHVVGSKSADACKQHYIEVRSTADRYHRGSHFFAVTAPGEATLAGRCVSAF